MSLSAADILSQWIDLHLHSPCEKLLSDCLTDEKEGLLSDPVFLSSLIPIDDLIKWIRKNVSSERLANLPEAWKDVV